jgi:hypothetical protein
MSIVKSILDEFSISGLFGGGQNAPKKASWDAPLAGQTSGRVDDRRRAGKYYGHLNPTYSVSWPNIGWAGMGTWKPADWSPKPPGSLEAQAGANVQLAKFYRGLMQPKFSDVVNWPVKLRNPPSVEPSGEPDIASTVKYPIPPGQRSEWEVISPRHSDQ